MSDIFVCNIGGIGLYEKLGSSKILRDVQLAGLAVMTARVVKGVRDQVLLLESLLKEKKDELKRLEAVDAEKNRLFATVVSLGLTVDDAVEILQRHRSVVKTD